MSKKGLVYDAGAVSRILGLPVDCGEPAPDAVTGTVTVYYGGWNLVNLQASRAGRAGGIWQKQVWYHSRGWTAEMGYYQVLLPVPGSDHKKWCEQDAYLRGIFAAGFKPTPVCVATTALLVHRRMTNVDPLDGHWCRCAEITEKSKHVLVGGVDSDGITIDYGYSDHEWRDNLFLVASRRIEPCNSNP